MKIAIFGASGGTGKLLTERCLAAGHSVSALLRRPAEFASREQVRVVQGSAFDPAAIADTLQGTSVVLSALGAKSPFKREDVLERAIPLVVAAMQASGPKRIIALGSAGALSTSLDRQPALSRWLAKKFVYNGLLKYPVLDQVAQHAALSTSGLDWTMVLPPVLTNTSARGRYRVDGQALPRFGVMISRADVADFMMQQITDLRWVRKGVYITW